MTWIKIGERLPELNKIVRIKSSDFMGEFTALCVRRPYKEPNKKHKKAWNKWNRKQWRWMHVVDDREVNFYEIVEFWEE